MIALKLMAKQKMAIKAFPEIYLQIVCCNIRGSNAIREHLKKGMKMVKDLEGKFMRSS